MEVGLRKEEIRQLAKYYNLANWDKPSMPCLASRIPYGNLITKKKLKQTEEAESYLHSLGIKKVRVHHHNSIARLEINQDIFDFLMKSNVKNRVINKLHKLGFTYVTLDLEDFRSGSLNKVLK